MRLSLRFILPLVAILSLIAYGITPLVEQLTLHWFMKDLDIRAELIANSVQEPLVAAITAQEKTRITQFFERLTKDERLFALGFCEPTGRLAYRTSTYPANVTCNAVYASQPIVHLSNGSVHVSFKTVSDNGQKLGQLVVIHDMSFVERRSTDTKKYILYLFFGLTIVISAATVLVARLSWRGWVSGLRSLLKGEGLIRPAGSQPDSPELRPIIKDLRSLVRDLDRERKIRDELQISWTPKALKEILQKELAGDEVLIVSNRQPYIHNKKNGVTEVQIPASGLVTALEPIMRACSGTWIAHGSGTADREVVDSKDHVRVPPEKPSYQIRRVWLTKEEEDGYYYGFSNEGLWPLCHIAHTRPTFRKQDFDQYVKVNQKFADAVISEAKTEDPVILVQDYHFALLPKMVREKLPRATIITFWHIPWPNSESFGICPWREEILEGLLGSSIVGFHTRLHCNNFIDSIDRFLECRIDRDSSTISYGKKLTAVNAYPVSIEWPSRWLAGQKPVSECRSAIRKKNGLSPDHLIGIGVDRLDYTKGILERFLAVERLLELNSSLIGKFTFIQIAAPSRATIDSYRHLDSDVRAQAARINNRFGKAGYEPICLKVEHHGPEQIFEYFRGADTCFVSSLHDGMNLVAKEFIAARDDEQGVLILSQFTGAARELPEALIVNPYNIDQCAQALEFALHMPYGEQKERMRSMRGLVQEYNVYRWAGRMLMHAARLRQQDRLLTKSSEGARV
jgi:trehalose 6-phosphate synthase